MRVNDSNEVIKYGQLVEKFERKWRKRKLGVNEIKNKVMKFR